MKVAGYVRVSAVAGREGESFQSPGQQEKAIRGYCRSRGLTLAEVVPELDESGAKLERSYGLRASGAGMSAVSRQLDREFPGGPSGHGLWSRSTVARVLRNRVYLGEARQGEFVNPHGHLPVVSQETFDVVEALAKRRE